jgi:hypothetical protein
MTLSAATGGDIGVAPEIPADKMACYFNHGTLRRLLSLLRRKASTRAIIAGATVICDDPILVLRTAVFMIR